LYLYSSIYFRICISNTNGIKYLNTYVELYIWKVVFLTRLHTIHVITYKYLLVGLLRLIWPNLQTYEVYTHKLIFYKSPYFTTEKTLIMFIGRGYHRPFYKHYTIMFWIPHCSDGFEVESWKRGESNLRQRQTFFYCRLN